MSTHTPTAEESILFAALEHDEDEWLRRLSNAFVEAGEGNLLSDYPMRLHDALLAVVADAYNDGYAAGRDDAADEHEDATGETWVI